MTAACLACLAQFALPRPLSALKVQLPVYALALGMAVFSTMLPSLLLSMGIQRIAHQQHRPCRHHWLGLCHTWGGDGLGQLLGSLLVLAGVLVVSLGKN